MKRLNTLFLSALLSFYSYADVTIINNTKTHLHLAVNESYLLGDNDTITSAKALLLEAIKKSATDFSGSSVQSELVLTGDEVTKQQISIIAASYVEVTDVKYNRAASNGAYKLMADAKVSISKKSIQDGLERLKSDPIKKEKIAQLEKDNARLTKRLLDLTNKINQGQREDLIAARNEVLKTLQDNRSSVKQVFEKGTLFQLANLDDQEYELAQKDIDENVINYFNNTKIELGSPQFIRQGKCYDVTVPVGWQLSRKSADAVLDKYFQTGKNNKTNRYRDVSYSTRIRYAFNTGIDAKRSFTAKLFKYITSRRVYISVNIGDTFGKLYLMDFTDGASNYETRVEMQFAHSDSNPYNVGDKEGNKVVLECLSEHQLKNANTVTAEIVIN